MRFQFHPLASEELNAAIDFYEARSPGLGIEFMIDVNEAIERIIEYPDAWTILFDKYRRCLTRRFPYGIIYYKEGQIIIIIAVMQLNREPGYWKERKN